MRLLGGLAVHEVLPAGVRIGEEFALTMLTVPLLKSGRFKLVLVRTFVGIYAFAAVLLFHTST